MTCSGVQREQAAGGAAAGGGDGGHLDFTPSRTASEPARNLHAVASSSAQQAERTASRVRPPRPCNPQW